MGESDFLVTLIAQMCLLNAQQHILLPEQGNHGHGEDQDLA